MVEWLYNISKIDNNEKITISKLDKEAYIIMCENKPKMLELLHNLSIENIIK